MHIPIKALAALFITIVLTAQAAAQTQADYIPKKIVWKKACNGVDRLDFKSNTVPVSYHAVKIDLTSGIRLVTYPDVSDFPEISAAGYLPVKTKTFAKKNKCIVAFNATPFIQKDKKNVYLAGVHKKDGILFSKPNGKYAALAFTKDMTASVISIQTAENCSLYEHVFGGFYCILENGVEKEFKKDTTDSRCSAGVSKDGKTLYILVAEGESPGRSRGLSFSQCARILKTFGCHSALEFDGGGSAQLCLKGRSVLSYTQLRSQANSIGFTF